MESKSEPPYIEYLGCPFCGRSVHLSVLSDKTFNSYNVAWALYQYRRARGGRGRGGFYVAKQGLSIKEMLKSRDPKIRDLAKKVIGRLRMIVHVWKEEGLL